MLYDAFTERLAFEIVAQELEAQAAAEAAARKKGGRKITVRCYPPPCTLSTTCTWWLQITFAQPIPHPDPQSASIQQPETSNLHSTRQFC